MKVTVELPKYGMSFSVANEDDDLNVWQLRTLVLVPLLRSVGYKEESIEDILGEGMDDFEGVKNWT